MTSPPPRPRPVVAVAYSGGRDSTALLHAVWRAVAAGVIQASVGPVRILALHVHHGLSARANEWLAHCDDQCRQWSQRGPEVEFRAHRLTTRPGSGDSIEAWAREQRYQALERMAGEACASIVLLAHHRRDQAETFLLQALRGAGPAGLSSMWGRRVDEGGQIWLRPWLHLPRESIEAYVRDHALPFVDDDSNSDHRFARNRLRGSVWPAWTQAFPGAEAALVQAAQRAQQAQACLDDLATLDLARVAPEGPLCLVDWQGLPTHRQANALKAWLAREPGRRVPRAQLEHLLAELMDPLAGPGRWQVGQGRLRRYRGFLTWEPQGTDAMNGGASGPVTLAVEGPGEFLLPQWQGRLVAFATDQGGWAGSPASLTVRPRCGGERFQIHPGRPARCLKKLFQAAAIPPWDRQGPLIFLGDDLLFVPGLGLDARCVAPRGTPQIGLRWEPDPKERRPVFQSGPRNR